MLSRSLARRLTDVWGSRLHRPWCAGGSGVAQTLTHASPVWQIARESLDPRVDLQEPFNRLSPRLGLRGGLRRFARCGRVLSLTAVVAIGAVRNRPVGPLRPDGRRPEHLRRLPPGLMSWRDAAEASGACSQRSSSVVPFERSDADSSISPTASMQTSGRDRAAASVQPPIPGARDAAIELFGGVDCP
jgi:hypothetical protein